MKKLSAYINSGERNAASYYRVIQYSKMLDDVEFKFRKRLPDKVYKRVTPMSGYPLFFKFGLFLLIYFRIITFLIVDLFWKPNVIFIQKPILPKIITPLCKCLLLLHQKLGVTIIFDFDDQIMASHDISKKNFDFISKISSLIFVASPYLVELVEDKWKGKVLLLPTTDSETYLKYNDSIMTERSEIFLKQIRLVWVATSSSLSFLIGITNALEIAGKILAGKGKRLVLTVCCNKPLVYDANNFEIENHYWERDVALADMLKAHIGIMPLQDNEFNRGKGGFKLIQYIGCALPVIGSSVGINDDIITKESGVSVKEVDTEGWVNAIIQLSQDIETWREYSKNALDTYEKKYNYLDNLAVWRDFLFK